MSTLVTCISKEGDIESPYARVNAKLMTRIVVISFQGESLSYLHDWLVSAIKRHTQVQALRSMKGAA